MMNSFRLMSFLFPSLTWHVKTGDKTIYLTFDDGPIPEVTPWVLEQLQLYNAKATFFCIGDNVRKHPNVYNDIVNHGHRCGNHTFHHYNAWKVNSDVYIKDVMAASQVISSELFRPPYGRITPSLIRKLKTDYSIVMWDVLSYDFDKSFTGEQCAQRVISKARLGSIIVFHDSLKAEDRLRIALPKTLQYFSENGFTFHSLP